MKYGVLAKMRKGVSMLVSIALVLSIAPEQAMQKN